MKKELKFLGIYSRLDRLDKALADLTSLFQLNDGRTLQDKQKVTLSIGQDFSDYYSTKKIYLDESLCSQIEEIQKVLREAWVAFDTSQSEKDHQDDRFGLRRRSSDLVREKFPPLKKQLEVLFKKELGSIEG